MKAFRSLIVILVTKVHFHQVQIKLTGIPEERVFQNIAKNPPCLPPLLLFKIAPFVVNSVQLILLFCTANWIIL